MTVERYAAFLAVVGILAFFVYTIDKIKAIKGAWRIRESVLLSLSFFGGAFGGYLAMIVARHKIRKAKFHFVNILGIVWQTALLLFLLNQQMI